MAWPDVTTLIDDFNRASIGTGWTTGSWYGDGALAISGSTVLTSASTGYGGGYYNTAQYGPDIDLIIDVPNAATTISLFARLSSGNSPYGYKFQYNAGNSGIYTVTDGSDSILGATFTMALSNGDKLGLEIKGNVITVYRYTGGAWGAAVATRTDAGNLYPNAGYFGIEVESNSITLDNMSGGSITNDLSINRSGASAEGVGVADTVIDLDVIDVLATLSVAITPDISRVQGVKVVG